MRAWAFYDWANSVYSLVISTAIFPIFYNSVTKGSDEEISHVQFLGYRFVNTELYSYIIGLSFLVVILLSPILSGVADYTGNKKRFLKIFCYLGSASCASMYFFDANHLEWSMISPLLASVGFWGSIVFYNAYLPEIAERKDHDKLSARGFALGYAGSVLLLVINLITIMKFEWFGFENAGQPTRLAFVLVAIWWAGFAQITFARLPKSPHSRKADKQIWRKGHPQLPTYKC